MSQLKFVIIILTELLFLNSCTNFSEENCQGKKIENNPLSIKSEVICNLETKNPIFGKIRDFAFVDDNTIAILTTNPSNIILFDTNGNFKQIIGKQGKGPYEYSSPSKVKSINSLIYVWCEMQLKLIIFEKDGTPLLEISSIKKAISSFEISENLIVFYIRGGAERIIAVYDTLKSEIIFNEGLATNEHQILGIMPNAGGLALVGEKIYYMYADALVINILDLRNFSITKNAICDKSFYVGKVKESATNIINHNIEKAIDYVLKNCRVIGLVPVNEGILVVSESGALAREKSSIRILNRSKNFYLVLDNGIIKKNSYLFDKESDIESNFLYTSHNGLVYTIDYFIDNDDVIFQLKKISFQ
jgi:hypothetical protein